MTSRPTAVAPRHRRRPRRAAPGGAPGGLHRTDLDRRTPAPSQPAPCATGRGGDGHGLAAPTPEATIAPPSPSPTPAPSPRRPRPRRGRAAGPDRRARPGRRRRAVPVRPAGGSRSWLRGRPHPAEALAHARRRRDDLRRPRSLPGTSTRPSSPSSPELARPRPTARARPPAGEPGRELTVTAFDRPIPSFLLRSAVELALAAIPQVRDPRYRELTIDGSPALRVDFMITLGEGGERTTYRATQVVPAPRRRDPPAHGRDPEGRADRGADRIVTQPRARLGPEPPGRRPSGPRGRCVASGDGRPPRGARAVRRRCSLAAAPEPWDYLPMPEVRPGPPWAMAEMIAAEPALAERIRQRLLADGVAAALADAGARGRGRRARGHRDRLRDVRARGAGHGRDAPRRVARGRAARPRDRSRPRRSSSRRTPPAGGLVIGVSHEGGTAATIAALDAAAGGAARGRRCSPRAPGAPAAALADIVAGDRRARPQLVPHGRLRVADRRRGGRRRGLLAGTPTGRRGAPRARSADGIEAAHASDGDGHARDLSIGRAIADASHLLVVGVRRGPGHGPRADAQGRGGACVPSAMRDLETFLHGHLPATGASTALVLVLTRPRRRPSARTRRARQALAAAGAAGIRCGGDPRRRAPPPRSPTTLDAGRPDRRPGGAVAARRRRGAAGRRRRRSSS